MCCTLNTDVNNQLTTYAADIASCMKGYNAMKNNTTMGGMLGMRYLIFKWVIRW